MVAANRTTDEELEEEEDGSECNADSASDDVDNRSVRGVATQPRCSGQRDGLFAEMWNHVGWSEEGMMKYENWWRYDKRE